MVNYCYVISITEFTRTVWWAQHNLLCIAWYINIPEFKYFIISTYNFIMNQRNNTLFHKNQYNTRTWRDGAMERVRSVSSVSKRCKARPKKTPIKFTRARELQDLLRKHCFIEFFCHSDTDTAFFQHSLTDFLLLDSLKKSFKTLKRKGEGGLLDAIYYGMPGLKDKASW